MRHLVLYKLAGFPTADKVPLFGELCYGKNRVFKKTFARNGQKSSFFALFWPKNAIFWHFLAPRVPPEQNPIFGGFAPPDCASGPPARSEVFRLFQSTSATEREVYDAFAALNNKMNFGMATSWAPSTHFR
jgi:hypothetical protein